MRKPTEKVPRGRRREAKKTIPINAIVKRGHDWVYEENGKLKKFKPNQLIATCPSCLSGAIKWSDVRNKRQATTISELRCNRQAVGKCDHEDAKKRSEMRKRKADEDNPDDDEQQDEPDSKLVKSETTSGETNGESRELAVQTTDRKRKAIRPVKSSTGAARNLPLNEIAPGSAERELNPLDKLLQNVLPSHARELSAQLQAAGVAGAVASAAVSGSGPEVSIGGGRARGNAYGRRSSPDHIVKGSISANGSSGIPSRNVNSSGSSNNISSVRSSLGAERSSVSLLDLGPAVVKRDPEESPQRQSSRDQNVFDNLRLGVGDASGHHNVRSLHTGTAASAVSVLLPPCLEKNVFIPPRTGAVFVTVMDRTSLPVLFLIGSAASTRSPPRVGTKDAKPCIVWELHELNFHAGQLLCALWVSPCWKSKRFSE
eukprot:INCI6223.13.p1 GENE.INCI6223.13~~INCI6223.13.p1  ORF type:complete len:429 (+),score=53.27 INCI6223.13:531-1817(+)